VVTDISSNVSIIWTYNASANSWTSWTGAGDDGNFRLEPGVGYWIRMSSADTLMGNYNLTPAGPSSPPKITIYAQAWNLIGHWATYNQTASVETYGALRTLADLSYIGSLSKWTGTGYTQVLGETMSPGDGYWMFMTSATNKEYGPNCAT